jgi:cellulose synthase (UDP-forming)
MSINKYAYAIKNPVKIRVMYAVTLVAYIFSVIGLIQFFNLNIWYWFLIFPFCFPAIYSRTVGYFVSVFYPGFDVEEHKKLRNKYWQTAEEVPTADIFLPIAGEAYETLEKTWRAVAEVRYPKGAKQVYVLEDRKDERARILAKELGFNYLIRPNQGEHKKAGNLKYGYENSDGEFVLILDADFVPHKDILLETIPYMKDPDIGIVQTPQYFDTNDTVHKRSPIEYGAGNVVEDFYRILQPARSFFGAAICVGTSSLNRRKAIFDSHAPALVERSEDVVSGLTLLKHGYELRYIPVVVSKGDCPDNIESYFNQHNRWCTGSVMLLFSTFFWRIKMTLIQRIIFSSSSFYYLAEASSVFVSLQLFLLMTVHYDSISVGHTLWFIPYIIMRFLVVPSIKLGRPRIGTSIAALTHIYTYLYSIFTIIANSTLEWKATGLKTIGVSRPFRIIARINAFYVSAWLLMTGYIFYKQPFAFYNIDAYLIIFWIAYGLIVHGFYAWQIVKHFNMKNREAVEEGLLPAWKLHTWRLRTAVQAIIIFTLSLGIGSQGFFQEKNVFSQDNRKKFIVTRIVAAVDQRANPTQPIKIENANITVTEGQQVNDEGGNNEISTPAIPAKAQTQPEVVSPLR